MAQTNGKAPQRGQVVRGGRNGSLTQQQQNARHAPPRQQRAAQQLPQRPQSTADLRGLLRQYGNVLTPQNRQLLQDVITQVEKGDTQALRQIAGKLQKQLGK